MHSPTVAEELYSLCEKSSLCCAILEIFTREGYKSPQNPPNSELMTRFVLSAVEFFSVKMTSSSDRCPCLDLKLEHCLCRAASLLLLCGAADAPTLAVRKTYTIELSVHACCCPRTVGRAPPPTHLPPFFLNLPVVSPASKSPAAAHM